MIYTHVAYHWNVPCLRDDCFSMAGSAFRAEKYSHLVAYHLRDGFGRMYRFALRVVPF